MRKLAGCFLVVLSAVALVACEDEPERAELVPVSGRRGGDGAVFDPTVGDCLNVRDSSGDFASSSTIVPCDEPHDIELFLAYSASGDAYPGQTALLDEAWDRCLEGFEPFVGTPYLESELDVTAVWPTEGDWEDGDRVVHCGVFPVDGTKVTGTMEGAAR